MTPREDKERSSREGPPPKGVETTSPMPQADYSIHTVQTVLEMQRTLGGVENAIKHLEGTTKDHGDKLDKVGKDVHAAKVVMSFVGGLIVLVGGFLGWTINTLLQYFLSHPAAK
jgi:hypothetical protein